MRDARLTELEGQMAALAQAYCERKAELESELGESPYVVGWVLAYEFTGVQQERDDTAGHGVVVPDGQMVAASVGLGHLAAASFSPQWEE